ncbi:DUF742 domain-containing protein [Nonomuraea sp. NPDC049480]|uniref:DUF742 domain-containing protein n=1 Tax=Nonomuraea sp. NPDC049480 TaxID=3364353 RepID=UPI0037998E5A
MTGRSVDREDPDRLYTVTGGRTRADETAFDPVSLIVGECEPTPGMQSEHVKILRLARQPMAVVEISAELRLPVSVVKILLRDLLDTNRITVRHPSAASRAGRPDAETLKQVLIALRDL